MNRREKCCSSLLFALGLIIFIIGILIIALMPMMTKLLLDQQVPLKQGGLSQRMWQDPPFSISMQFTLFNITNPLEIIHRGAKPVLVQKGPYGYKETQIKKQVQYMDDKISYINHKIYHFDPDLSCKECRETDAFTVPNLPYITALSMVDKVSRGEIKLPIPIPGDVPMDALNMAAPALLMAALGSQLFISNVTAGQLLFGGYDDQMFSIANQFLPGFAPKKMGFLYGRNDTDDGVYVIDSGTKDTSKMGTIITWKGHENLDWLHWWNSTEASQIMGSDGSLYPQFIKRTDPLPGFISDICRSLTLVYSADIDVKGVKAFRFRQSKRAFDADAPENRGFCWPMPRPIYSPSVQMNVSGGWCLPSGMNDVSRCQQGNPPVVVSMAQFVLAPEEVQKSVIGLDEPSDNYLSYIDIEPTSGLLLKGSRIAQLNTIVEGDPKNIFTKNLKSVIIPLVWINETVAVDDATFAYVFQNVVVIRESAYIAGYACLGVGLLWMICVAVGCLVSRQNAKVLLANI